MPNLFDLFGAYPEDGIYDPNNVERRAWVVKFMIPPPTEPPHYPQGTEIRTNWFWYLMLHFLDPDPHGLVDVE